MSKNYKRSFKDFVKIVCLVLLCAVVSVTAVSLTNGFDQDRNEDNLLTLDCYESMSSRIHETGDGVTFDWNDDGSVRVRGKNEVEDLPEEAVSYYDFATVTLQPGTYTISSCYKKAEDTTLGIYYEINGEKVLETAEDGVFELTEITEVVIGIYVGNDIYFAGAKLCPVIVEGDTAGSFYAE